MPRSYSLKSKKEFEILFKNGERKYSKNFSIVSLPALELKFGLIIQKKNVKLASHRNYGRRIIREILRTEFIPNFGKTRHIGIVCKVNLKTNIDQSGLSLVKAELINILRQIR